MADIPRFNAQLTQLSVPRMVDYQKEQNETIYNALSDVSRQSQKLAEDMYLRGQQHKAEVQAAEDVKEKGKDYNLSELPTPYTMAQKAYNESAVNAFAAQYTVDTSLALTNLEYENQDNPQQFLAKAQSYIAGTSENIPEYLKASIVKPLEMNARSIYSTLLMKRVTKDKKANSDSFMINVDEQIRLALNIDDGDAQDEAIAQVITNINNGVASGNVTYEYASKKIGEVRMGVASKRLSDKFLLDAPTPDEIRKTIRMAMTGNTGILAFDSLSPEERMKATRDALDLIAFGQGYLGHVADNLMKEFTGSAAMEAFKEKKLTPEEFKPFSWGDGSLEKMTDEAINQKNEPTSTIIKQSQPVAIFALNSILQNGSLEQEDITKAYDDGLINGTDAFKLLSDLNGPLSINKKKDGYIEYKTNLDIELQDIKNDRDGIEQKNMKKEYIEKNMDAFLSKQERTDEEIMQASAEIQEKADKHFNKNNEYSKVHTPSWFKEKTGYDISAIESIVSSCIREGVLDKKQLGQKLLQLTGNNQDMANKIYSYYLAVKKR